MTIEAPQASERLPRLTGLTRDWPKNLDAEQAFLGAFLTNSPRVLPLVEEFLEPEHFYVPEYGKIYRAARRIAQAGQIADPVTLLREFAQDPTLGDRPAADVLANLMKSMVGIVNAGDYARVIRDAWLRRALMNVCDDVSELCCRPGERSAVDVMELVEEKLLALSRGVEGDDPNVSFGDALSTAIGNARDAVARGRGLAGISSGYAGLDRMTLGLQPGCFYVLAARPAMGKTAMGLGIAARVAAQGLPTYFWSGEMTPAQLGARAGAAYAGLPTLSVFSGRRYDRPEEVDENGLYPPLDDWQWRELELAERAAWRLPIEIDHRPAISVAKLRSRARRLARRPGGLKLIVVDYVGLMRGSADARKRGLYAEVTEISNELKGLAKELNVPLVALAQLNRESEKREDKRPVLSDLRDSGALEQDADVIMMLHREHYYLKKQLAGGSLIKREKESNEDYANRMTELEARAREAEGRGTLLVNKNRHGPEGAVRLQFDNQSTWFRDEGEDTRSAAWVMAEARA